MSARFLMGVFDSVYLVALAAWVGGVFFFSFVVAPVVLRVLSAQEAAKFVRALFPRYHMALAVAGAAALPAFVAVPLSYPEYRGPIIAAQALVILSCILMMLYAANSLTPAIIAAVDSGPAGRERSRRLHHRSLLLNSIVLAAGVGLLIAHATRPVPRTSGLRQLSPAETARFDAELGALIERMEIKYGFRPGSTQPDEINPPPGRVIDPEMVKELEGYYERKRQRELTRRGRETAEPKAHPTR